MLGEDPEYLKAGAGRASPTAAAISITSASGLLALVLSCWEVFLSKGQEWDWLGDPFGRMQTLMTLMIVGLGRADRFGSCERRAPIIEFRVLRDRNLAMGCVILFSAFAVLYAGQHLAAGDAADAVWL